jgi:ATP-dependent Clp protease ATP-binding subunit ClpC
MPAGPHGTSRLSSNDYDKTLHEGEDVIASTRDALPAMFRDSEIDAAVAALTRKRSLLLVGPPGVGKSAVAAATAQRLGYDSGIGVRRFTTTQILSGTRYIGDWQTKLTRLMTEAEDTRTVINIVDVWNLASVGQTTTSTNNLLDAMRPWLTAGRLRVMSEITPEQLTEISQSANFVSLFDVVRVEPLTGQQLRQIVEREADSIGLALPAETRERMFSLSETFSPATAGPGPAIDLVRKLRDYREQKLAAGEAAEITPLLAEKVFAIHSGLPLFVVSRSETKPAAEIRDWFRDRIIGQEAAIDAVIEMIAFYKARLHDKSKPIGSFLFVGPTGVGKTELARCLAEFFFGSERRMLRFDMSEFADYNSFELLVGSLRFASPRPARLIDPVRVQPFQVLLFDELEKGHRNVQDLFLQLLDEGRLTTPQGETVSFRNTIIVATSNAGAMEGMSSSIGFGGQRDSYDADKALAGIEANFRPEFLNRFQHVVLFHPLTREQAARIARIDLQSVLRREGIAGQNLIVDVHDDVIDHVLTAGFNPRYGGRGIKREVRRQVVLPIANLLMERALEAGTLIDVGIVDGRVRVRAIDTPETAAAKAERAPVRIGAGERLTVERARERIDAARATYEALAAACELSRLRREIDGVDSERRDHTFWGDPDRAGRVLAQQSRALATVGRIERLQNALDDLARAFRQGSTRNDLAAIGNRLLQLEAALAIARRELVAMGDDGWWDAVVELMPVGPGSEARDFLFGIYRDWADERGVEVVMLHEPMGAAEPIAVALKGHFAHGYLARETGHHRVRRGAQISVARVTVAPLDDSTAPVEFVEQRPLKATGALGGKVRSRVGIVGCRLVLQNERNLSQNRELARDIAPSWPRDSIGPPPRVRRYDLDPFLVRDYLTGADFTRKDVLSPKLFHKLLCDRVDCGVRGEGVAREVG